MDHDDKVARARTIDSIDDHRASKVLGADGLAYLIPATVLDAVKDAMTAQSRGGMK